jgi:disulfide bond formation protein DsbB
MSRGARAAALAAAGSAALLAAAFAFQHLGGLAPCTLCVWQRWPHVVAVAAGAAAASAGERARRPMAALAALALLAGAGIAGFHVGVEQGWWEGPGACAGAGGAIGAMSVDDLLAQIQSAPVVRCDEVAWSFGGLSMAAWNGLASLGLAALFLYASSSASQYKKSIQLSWR